MTTTLKLDWDQETIQAVSGLLKEHLRAADGVPLAGVSVPVGVIRQAVADIEVYRLAVEAVKAEQAGETVRGRIASDIASLMVAEQVALRRNWPGLARSCIRAAGRLRRKLEAGSS